MYRIRYTGDGIPAMSHRAHVSRVVEHGLPQQLLEHLALPLPIPGIRLPPCEQYVTRGLRQMHGVPQANALLAAVVSETEPRRLASLARPFLDGLVKASEIAGLDDCELRNDPYEGVVRAGAPILTEIDAFLVDKVVQDADESVLWWDVVEDFPHTHGVFVRIRSKLDPLDLCFEDFFLALC